MGIIAKDNGGDLEPVPLGMCRAICVNVFDIGYQAGYQGAPPKHQVIVLWEIEPTKKWEQDNGKHFTVTKFYTLSINKKSNLGADLESWRGRQFTEEELEGFDLDNIIGKPCQLNLVANGDKAKVATVLPPVKGSDGKMLPLSEYWPIETARDFVPNFVKTKQEQALPPPSSRASGNNPGNPAFDEEVTF